MRLAHALREPSGRRRHGAFLVEGLRVVQVAAARQAPRLVLHTPRFGQTGANERALLRRLRAAGVPVRSVTERALEYVAETVTPQGIVAVLPLPAPGEVWGGSTETGDPALVLVLDGIGDPGNAGTLLRSAAAAGATAVIASKGTVDLFSPKVVRAAAGAHFHLPLLVDLPWDDVPRHLPGGCTIRLADQQGQRPYWAADWRVPCAVVVSNEARGASVEARRLAQETVAIPQRQMESLNAGVAGSIILFEALRQRQE